MLRYDLFNLINLYNYNQNLQYLQMTAVTPKMENFRKKNNLDIIIDVSETLDIVEPQQKSPIIEPQIEMMPVIKQNTLQHLSSSNLMSSEIKMCYSDINDQNRRSSFNSNFSQNFWAQNNQHFSFEEQMRPFICEIKQQIIDVHNYCKQQIEAFLLYFKAETQRIVIGIKNRVSSILSQKNKEIQTQTKIIQQLQKSLKNRPKQKDKEIQTQVMDNHALEKLKEQLNKLEAENIYLKSIILKYKEKYSNSQTTVYQTNTTSQVNIQYIKSQDLFYNHQNKEKSYPKNLNINQHINLINLKSAKSIKSVKDPQNCHKKTQYKSNYLIKSIQKKKTLDMDSNNLECSAYQRLEKTYSPRPSLTNSKMVEINKIKQKLKSLKIQIMRQA